jgi:hypothetical protein
MALSFYRRLDSERRSIMSFFSSLLRRMTGRPHTRRTLPRKPTTRFRPQLEALESRDLPSFTAPVVYPSYGTHALATADMNGDGKADLISVSNGDAVTVWLNNGNGTFRSGPGHWFQGASLDALAVTDKFGSPPLIVVATSYVDGAAYGQTEDISLLQLNSNGTFTEWTYHNVFPTESLTSLATADFSGKGTLDVVATNSLGEVYVASGADNFQTVQTYQLGASSGHVAVGDFNGDGKDDFVVAVGGTYASGGTFVPGATVSVFLNNGDGTFAAPQSYTLLGSPTAGGVPSATRGGRRGFQSRRQARHCHDPCRRHGVGAPEQRQRRLRDRPELHHRRPRQLGGRG